MKLIPLALIGMGLVPLGMGLVGISDTLSYVRTGHPAEAVVEATKRQAPWPGRYSGLYPQVRYQAQDGQEHRADLPSYQMYADPPGNLKISIIVNSNDPTQVRVNSWRELWAQPALGVLCGMVLIGVGTIFGLKRRHTPETA